MFGEKLPHKQQLMCQGFDMQEHSLFDHSNFRIFQVNCLLSTGLPESTAPIDDGYFYMEDCCLL
jgi:hypothetical protein